MIKPEEEGRDAEGELGHLAPHTPHTPRPGGWELLLFTVAAIGVLAVFAALILLTEPDARGHGTHEQLGMFPCSWPLSYGIPCPTCGVTTSSSLLLHLHPVDSLRTQPFGFALTLAGLYFVWAWSRALWRRESLAFQVAFWPWGRILWGGILLLLLAWGYKILVF